MRRELLLLEFSEHEHRVAANIAAVMWVVTGAAVSLLTSLAL